MPIRKILVPLDGSQTGERAIPWAKAVARDQAEIVLLEVTPVASSVRSIGGQIVGTAETIQEGYRQLAERQLNDSMTRWFDNNDKVSTQIESGDPGEQIMNAAIDQDADLIVMSSHGRGAVGRFVSGSVADRVVRHAPLPVMIVGPEGDIGEQVTIDRIIAPVDDSPLSLAALPVAASFSKTTGAPVIALHVINASSDSTTFYPSVIGTLPPSAYEMAQERMIADARAVVDKAVKVLEELGCDATGEAFTGLPAESIMATLQPGDVIVLSSHARQGLARWVIGSTSMKLIRNGQAPVVVVTRESIERNETDQVSSGS